MQLQAARAKLTDSRERPSGDLKITTTPGVGINWLIPRLGEFTGLPPPAIEQKRIEKPAGGLTPPLAVRAPPTAGLAPPSTAELQPAIPSAQN